MCVCVVVHVCMCVWVCTRVVCAQVVAINFLNRHCIAFLQSFDFHHLHGSQVHGIGNNATVQGSSCGKVYKCYIKCT